MQFQNDDMDDLLRRAAEHYPLDTSGADWNKVINALQQDENKEAAAVPARKSSRGRLLWLLMLLPLGLVCNYYYGNGLLKGKNIIQADQSTIKKTIPGDPVLPDQKERTNNQKIEQVETIVAGETGKEAARETETWKNLPVNKSASSHPNEEGTGKSHGTVSYTQSTADKKPLPSVIQIGRNKTNIIRSDIRKTTVSTPGVETNHVSPSIDNVAVQHVDERETRQLAEAIKNNFPFKGAAVLPLSSIVSDQHLSKIVTKPKLSKIPAEKFYAGIMGGVDMTTVKFQKIENYGHDYGILLGYRFNSKWSVETGLYRDSKNYYSDGKYFNSKKIYLPSNTKITEVSGNCLMWEIPVNVKFDFAKIKKHSWYATAGMSSYLMKKEDYSYLYYYGGSGTSAWHDRSYKNASKNLFSVVNLSAGYSRKIGKLGEIRIEPYFKLPVSKMGIGDMPLMSAGLHVGFTKTLF